MNARAKSIKQKHQRMKEGKFESRAEKLKLSDLGKKKSGCFMETRVGIKNVYKKPSNRIVPFVFNPFVIGKIAEDKGGRKRIKETKSGHNVLKRAKLPVTEYKGVKKIKGKEYLVFEKALPIKEKELASKIDEIAGIIQKAADKKVYFDTRAENFGINSEGKVVIMDTNNARKHLFKSEKLIKEEMIKTLTENLKRNYVEKETRKKIEKRLSELV